MMGDKMVDDKMKKIFLAVLVLAMLFLSGCAFFFTDEEVMKVVKSGKWEDCYELDESEKKGRVDDCLYRIGMDKDDPEICAKVTHGGNKAYCYADVAKDTNNEKICENIDAQSNKYNCYVDVALKNDRKEVCEELVKAFSTTSFADDCYLKFAKQSDNAEDCASGFRDSDKQNECYVYMAEKLGDPGLCSKVLRHPYIDECYAKVGPVVKDRKYCDLVEQKSRRETCFLKLVEATGSNLYCKEISTQGTKNQCHLKAALFMQDSNECGFVTDDYQRRSCVKQVAVKTKDILQCAPLRLDGEEYKSCEMQVKNAIASSSS